MEPRERTPGLPGLSFPSLPQICHQAMPTALDESPLQEAGSGRATAGSRQQGAGFGSCPPAPKGGLSEHGTEPVASSL